VLLEIGFHKEMFDLYRRAKEEAGYNSIYFLKMLNDVEGLQTARILINEPIQSGFSELWEKGRLDLTIEAVIFDNPQWHPLFRQEELDIVKKRLKDCGYGPALNAP